MHNKIFVPALQMNLFINIVLFLTGTALAAVSYFGKPSEKVEGWRRIKTRHGAVSLTLWLLALGFSIWKEHRTEQKDDESAGAAVKVQKEAAYARMETKQKENELLSVELEANKQIYQSRLEAQQADVKLADVQKQLAGVNGTLSKSQETERAASSASLVSSLSNNDQLVQVLSFGMPFTGQAHFSTNQVRAFLPDFRERLCSELVGVSVRIDPRIGIGLVVPYTPSDSSMIVHGPGQSLEYASTIQNLSSQDGLVAIANFLGQRSRNDMYYEVDTDEDFLVQSSSVLFSALNARHSEPVTIQTAFPAWTYSDDVDAGYKRKFHDAGEPSMPKSCSDQIGAYFDKAFDKGVIMFATHQQHPEVILFPLRHLPPRRLEDGNWSVTFEVSGPPRFGAGLSLPSLLTTVPRAPRSAER